MARPTPGEILAYLLKAPKEEKPDLKRELAKATYDTLKAGVEPGTEVTVTISGFDGRTDKE